MRVEPMGAFGEAEIDPLCTCRPVHGNADTDGICDRCRPKVEAAQDARGTAIVAAFTRLAEQAAGMRFYDLEGLVTLALEAVTDTRTSEHDSQTICRLCRCYDDHAPNCAAPMLRELID